MNLSLLLLCLLILTLTITVYQDFKQRTIHVALPVTIFILAIVSNHLSIVLKLKDILFNSTFIIINIIGLVIYFSIKSKKIVNPIDSSIGLGDVVFFIAITPLFTLKPFVLFFITGLIFSLLLHIISNLLKEVKTIPLAGYLSVFLIGYLLLRDVFKLIEVY